MVGKGVGGVKQSAKVRSERHDGRIEYGHKCPCNASTSVYVARSTWYEFTHSGQGTGTKQGHRGIYNRIEIDR